MRIGIMGGTFDPIHFGHLIAAERVRDELPLDYVWFMPAAEPPHKHSRTVADPIHRLRMVEKAVVDHPKFCVSKLEFERQGTSYTAETMSILQKRYPEHEFYFIVGADMVHDLPNWYRIHQLVQDVQFVGLNRPGYGRPELPDAIAKRVRYVSMPSIGITSTDIRRKRAAGKSVRYLVPEGVREYMEANRLYET